MGEHHRVSYPCGFPRNSGISNFLGGAAFLDPPNIVATRWSAGKGSREGLEAAQSPFGAHPLKIVVIKGVGMLQALFSCTTIFLFPL